MAKWVNFSSDKKRPHLVNLDLVTDIRAIGAEHDRVGVSFACTYAPDADSATSDQVELQFNITFAEAVRRMQHEVLVT